MAVWFFKRGETNPPRSSGGDSLDTLKERLAKGEISEETYDRLKQKLHE
ncbi:SHOCT domain-containing protein [Lentibacillus kimchii]